MGVYGLTKYYCTHSRARKKVSLQCLAQKVLRTGKKAKLLCDYYAVMFPMLSQVDRMLRILHHKSSFYCDTNFEIYATKITSFVKAFQHLGIDLVFFVDGPHGVDELQFKAKFSTIKDRYLCLVKEQYNLPQEYSMIKQPINLQPTPTLLPVQWLMTLESAGVEIIYCHGEADQELAYYARSHPEVCGILSTDSDFAVIQGSTLFPYDLLKFTHGLVHGVHSRPDKIDKTQDITCETVSPSTLARALGIKEEQLPDLAILCGNDFTKPLNNQLIRYLKKDLMLEATDVESVAKWLQGKQVPLIDYRPFNIFCNKHPEYKMAVMYTYNCYSKDFSSLGVVSSKQSYNFFQAILLGISKCGIRWDDLIPEILIPGSPCVQELLLPLRKVIYFLLGMSSVREFGQTQLEPFTEISVLLPKHDESTDLRCLHSSNFRDLCANEKLLIFLYLTVNALKFGNHVIEIGKVPTQVASECASLDLNLPESLSLKGIFVCSCLQLIAYLNQHSTPRLNLSQAELDALLITCLSCCVELKLPHDCASLMPSIRSTTITSWFSRTLLHAYCLATLLGLSDSLPQPKHLFSPMVFLLLHSVATQNTNGGESRELLAMHTIWKKFMSFSSVTALSSVMFTRKAVESPALKADLEVLFLFANALMEVEVAHYQHILTCPKPESTSSSSSATRYQNPSMPHRRKRSHKGMHPVNVIHEETATNRLPLEHEWVTWFEQPDDERSEEEYREEEYDLSYSKLCPGNFTCKSCNKHFKEEQDYHDHHRKCYLCNFRACINILRKHEYKHAYCSVDVLLFGNPTPSKSVRCRSYIAGLQNVNKHISRNSGHLRSYRTLKKWNLIACREVVRIHRHCKISSGRNNTAENIISGKQSCEPCSRKGFKSQRSYQAHLKSHIRCDICGLEACPKVLTKHRLTHSEPLEPDAAGPSTLSHPPFCEPVAVAIVSKPIPFQPHVQPQETAHHEDIDTTAGKDTISFTDPALAGANNYTHCEGEATVAITDITHEYEGSQNDTEGHSTSDLQGQNSSQKVQQPSHKYKPGSEMHMVEYFKHYIEENGGEASISSLQRIAFQNFRKMYSGCPFLSKNLFKSHPQDFIVVEGAGFCRIKLEKCATEAENYKELVIPATESSPSIGHLDTSDHQKNDLATEQGCMVSVRQDAIMCSPIFLGSDSMHRSLDVADKEPPVPKAATMLLADPDLNSGHHFEPNNRKFPNVDSPSITADKPSLPRSESNHIQYQGTPGHDLPEQVQLLTNPPLSAVCATSGANGAVVVQSSMSEKQPALVVRPHEKGGSQDTMYTGDDSTADHQNSSQQVHKATPGSDMHLVMYLKDFIKNNNGEASITSLRRIPFPSYQEKYGGPLYLSKDLFKSYPQDFKVVEGAGFCRIKVLQHAQIMHEREEGGVPPSSNPNNPIASVPNAGDEDSDMINYTSSIRDVCAQHEKGKCQDFLTAWVTTPTTVSKMDKSCPLGEDSTSDVTSEMMATKHPSLEVHEEDSTTVTIVKPVVLAKQLQLQSSENVARTKHTHHQQHAPQQSVATAESSCKSSGVTENTNIKAKGTSNIHFVSGLMFVDGNENTQKDVSVDTKGSAPPQQLGQSGNTIQFASVPYRPPEPGSKLHLVEFVRKFLEQNGGEARLGVLHKCAFDSYKQKYFEYLPYSYLGKKFLRSYPEYFDISDGIDSCIVKLHKPIPPTSDATTLKLHAKPMPGSLPTTADIEREQETTCSEQVRIVDEDELHFSSIAADCAGPTHSPCLSQLKSMVQETCTAHVVNPDGSMSNTQQEVVHLDTSLESQASGSTEHIVKYFKEYLSTHGGRDGCHVDELMEMFDLKYKQECALPNQPPTAKVNKEFFRTHSDVFKVSKRGIVRLREITFKPVSQQTAPHLPLSKSGFLMTNIASQPLQCGLPNRDLPKIDDSLWPLKSESAPKNALLKVEDVPLPVNSETNLPMRGLSKSLWPLKTKNSLPKSSSPKGNEISKSRNSYQLKVGDGAPSLANMDVDEDELCFSSIAADCAGATHSPCLSQLKSMVQETCTAHFVNPDGSMSSSQQEAVHLDTSFESQALGTTEHIVKYFKEYLSTHGGGDGCHVDELMEVFDLKYKQECALPRQPPPAKVNKEFFRNHSDVFRVSRHDIVRLREITFKTDSGQTEYAMSQLPLSKSGFLRTDISESGLPNRGLPKNEFLWPLKSKGAPKSALPKVEDVPSPLKSKTNLPMRGLSKAPWPPKAKNSLPMSASPKVNEITNGTGQLLKVGDEAPISRSSANTDGVSQQPKTRSISLKVDQAPISNRGLPKADDASQPHIRKTKSDLPWLKHASQPQQSKRAHDVKHSALSQVTPSHFKGDPFTPQHVVEYFSSHLSRYGECSVEELKKTFESKYKKQYIQSSYAIITFVGEKFFRRRSDMFEVTTSGTVKLKRSARS